MTQFPVGLLPPKLVWCVTCVVFGVMCFVWVLLRLVCLVLVGVNGLLYDGVKLFGQLAHTMCCVCSWVSAHNVEV